MTSDRQRGISMKALSSLIVLALSIAMPMAQAQAQSQSTEVTLGDLRSAVNQLHSDLSSDQSKETFTSSSKTFFAKLQSLGPADRAAAVTELKSSLPYEAQDQVDALVDAASAGTLTNDQINARVLAIAKSSQISGAAWDAGPTYFIGGVVIFVLGILLLSGGHVTFSATPAYEPPYPPVYYPRCYNDPYYGLTCS